MNNKNKKKLVSLVTLILVGLLFPTPANAWTERIMDTEINLRFVYPNSTSVTGGLNSVKAQITNQFYKGVADPTGGTAFPTYTFESTQILKPTHEIPKVSNGVYQEKFTSPGLIKYGGIPQVGDPFQRTRLMEGAILGYTDLMIETDTYVRSIKGKTTTYTGTAYSVDGGAPPQRFPAKDRNNIPLTNNYQLTKTSPGKFKLESPAKLINLCEHLPKNSLEFTRNEGNVPYASGNYIWADGSAQMMMSYYFNPFTFEVDVPKIVEKFVDSTGTELTGIATPPGVTQGNTYYADNNTYTMGSSHNQPNTLPESYTTPMVGQKYLYKGWYLTSTKGAVHQANPPSFEWKHVPVGQEDEYGKVNVIYDKAKSYSIKEKYVYVDSQGNNVDIQSSWNKTTPNKYELDPFTPVAQPDAIKTDSSGIKWDYVGWKIGPNGTVNNTAIPAKINSIDDNNNELYYIYKANSTSAKIDLTPDSTVIHEFGKPIDWKLTIENTGSADLKNLDLSHSVTKMTYHGMTNPTNTIVKDNSNTTISGLTDNLWLDGGTELSNVKVKPGEKLTLTFNTTPSTTSDTGILEHLMKFKVAVNGNIANQLTDETKVRIDPDHHVVTETEGNNQLALLLVPNIFDFGFKAKANLSTTQTLSLDTSKYSDKTNSRGIFVRLQDPRPNNSANKWKLSAKLGRMESSGNQLPPTIKLKLASASSEKIANVNEITENRSPESISIDLNSNIELPADGVTTTKIMSNKLARNSGTWQLQVPLSGITMELPPNVGQEGEVYTSDITWTLEDTI
ncbi:WxL domain-containing protein [Enterococcus gilvus]|uniref:WxL domain-containing protein n=1 Tax=Enterococcus gilvus TaxID=160453 RepID=UPI001C8CE395|nr:WxL domain-containing protein [Enterococcus gilvus]MBX8935329.1 hypothetical protein [Enterococcus gilvus]